LKTLKLFAALIILIIYSCSDRDAESYDKHVFSENKFKNATLQEIYNFQNERNTNALIPYFESSKAMLREATALAFASLQDATALNELFFLLEEDKSEKVRLAAAFAIGQIGDSIAQNNLVRLFRQEKVEMVKSGIAEAIGKCGTESGLNFLLQQLSKAENNIALQNGILLGISRYSLRGIFSDEALEKILQLITNEETSKEVLFQATVSLIRLKEFSLNAYVEQLMTVFNKTKNIYTKINIISAFARTDSQASIDFISNILNKPGDYRLKVNAIRALTKRNYSDASVLAFSALQDLSMNVAIQASEYFIADGNNIDVQRYVNEASNSKNWRVKSNLFAAALKYSENKNGIARLIIDTYNSSSNQYEKANLLSALGNDIGSYLFVSQQVDISKDLVVGTYGLTALADMRRNKDFDSINQSWMLQSKKDLSKEFAIIFKDAVISGDMAKIAIAAELIRDSELDFRKQYENTYFLTQAMNKCKLPAEMEAYIELQKTIAFIDGKDESAIPSIDKAKIDWNYVSQIPYDQKVKIITSKGDILLELFVNQTPVGVANFLKLAERAYFDEKFIHRVVPNFVVQDGCPRGDGWGGPDYTICSEFALNYYTEGSLGMASAGKDTESSQWFITHSPTPHLDGRYTNFGKVVSGMDVVHQLEVGDKILSVEIVIAN